MPEETVEEKNEETTESEDTQSENTEEQSQDNQEETEDVSTLPEWAQKRLTKAETERENYSNALKSKKKDFNKSLEVTKEEESTTETEEESEEDQTTKDRKETLSQAEKIAEEKATKVFEKSNEDAAIEQFLSDNPELNNAENWAKLVGNYQPKSGRKTVKAILKDLDRAHFLLRYENGEIKGLTEEAEENGERKGKAQAQVEDAHTVSKDKAKKGTVTTDSAIERRLAGDLPPGF